MSNPLVISSSELQKVARRFLVLSEPLRLQILQTLLRNELCVGELVGALGGTQGNISRHLNILHNEGILGRRKEAQNTYYYIADRSVFELCRIVCGKS